MLKKTFARRAVLVMLACFIALSPSIASAETIFKRTNDILWYDEECEPAPTSTPTATPTSDDKDKTKDDKIAKILIPLFDASNKAGALTAIEKYKFGGMAMTSAAPGGGRVYDKAFFDDAKAKAGSPFIPMADEEGGKVARYGIATNAASDLAKMSTEDVKKEGQRVGEGLKSYGIEVDLAPVLDIQQSGIDDNHLTQGMGGKSRAFGSDAKTVTEKAGAFAEGLSAAGIKPTYKHFPGLGRAPGHSDHVEVTLDYNQLGDDLKPFKELANRNSGLVMLTNARITGLGGNDGTPAPTNPKLIEKLRGEVGFSGTIITDDLQAVSTWSHIDLPTTIVNSMKAGADLMIFAYPGDPTMDQIIAKIKGDVPDERINEAYSKSQSAGTESKPTETKTTPSGGSGKSCECSTGTTNVSATTGDGGGCGSKTDMEANKKQIWSFLKNKGLSDAGAAGIMGNAEQESSFNPSATNGIGCRGFVQWCFERNDALESFARDRGKTWDCLGLQLEYMWHEMEDGSNIRRADGVKVPQGKKLYDLLNGADFPQKSQYTGSEPAKAAKIFHDFFERANTAAGEDKGRPERAEGQYKALTGKEASSLGAGGGSGASCPSESKSDDSMPSGDCSTLVEELRKYIKDGKVTNYSGSFNNTEEDLKKCSENTNDHVKDCAGVTPKLLRVIVALIKHFDSKGLGPFQYNNMNKGHSCDGGKHTQGQAVDTLYGSECLGSKVYTEKRCVEVVNWIQQNHGAYDIASGLHTPCALTEMQNVSGCTKDGVGYNDPSVNENDQIHIGVTKNGRY